MELDQRWIVDVGFGDCYRNPLRLDTGEDQRGLRSQYRITPDGNGTWKFWELENGAWEFYYAFSLRPVRSLGRTVAIVAEGRDITPLVSDSRES